jgi:phage replication initiation protein
VKEIPARRGFGGSFAFIDWLNITFDESSVYFDRENRHNDQLPVTDDEIILSVSSLCETLFGFGITVARQTGANFYKRSWILGDGLGLVGYGGQRDTVLISLSGEGCAAAKPDWEYRLYQWLELRAVRGRITRVDLAHDDFTGASYSVDRGMADYDAGLFSSGGRPPEVETRGNWKRPSGKGRTLYIGSRTNGKFLRVYEKGRQLGDKNSEWVRVEGELKSVDRIVPFDVLLEPGAYLAAMYPALSWISTVQKRIETVQKEAVFSYNKMLEWLKRQAGASLNFALEMEGDAAALLAKLVRDELPKSLRGLKSWETAGTPIHKMVRDAGVPAIGMSLEYMRGY